MKVWYHLFAAVVGLSAAALIVFLVFGNASEEGATQEGSAPGAPTAVAQLCGSVTGGQTTSAGARRTAAANLPSIVLPTGARGRPANARQGAWFARVQAAGGLCVDEVRFPETCTPAACTASISLTLVDAVKAPQASAYAAGVLAQAFGAPINPRTVELTVTSQDQVRTANVSVRAWGAFSTARRQLRAPLTMLSLAQFRQERYRRPDLRVSGWG